jgi:NAD-dependent SIR2 family protein deacetylase
MTNARINLSNKKIFITAALDKAEAVIIGAGAGLSNAAGLRYDDTGFFNAIFPGYQDRYGLRTINEADFYPFPTPEEQYAYWTRHISAIRYQYPPGKPCIDLHRIIKDKNHFVLTTNTTANFRKLALTRKASVPRKATLLFSNAQSHAMIQSIPTMR